MPEDASAGSPSPVVEVEFSIDDRGSPFVAATAETPCVIELAEMVPRGGGEYAEFLTVTGTEPDTILAFTAPHDALDVTLLREYDDGGLFEFVTTGDCPAFALAELGALPREATSADGEGRIVADIPPEHDPSAVVETFLAETPGASLVSKREREAFSPPLTGSALQAEVDSLLTDRQREVLRAAYDAGYYEWPRKSSGTDVAEELDITSATFSEHIHAAERKLLGVFFERSMRG